MATLTLEVSDTLAQTVARLSESDRAAFIAHMNALAVETLQKDVDEAGDENDLPEEVYLNHPLPPILTQSLTEDMREAKADVEAGRLIKGDVALAELRRYVGRE